MVDPPPLRVVDPPPLRVVDPLPYERKALRLRVMGGVPQGLFAPGPAGWSLSSSAKPAVWRRSRQARGSGRAINKVQNCQNWPCITSHI